MPGEYLTELHTRPFNFKILRQGLNLPRLALNFAILYPQPPEVLGLQEHVIASLFIFSPEEDYVILIVVLQLSIQKITDSYLGM